MKEFRPVPKTRSVVVVLALLDSAPPALDAITG